MIIIILKGQLNPSINDQSGALNNIINNDNELLGSNIFLEMEHQLKVSKQCNWVNKLKRLVILNNQ